MNTLEKICQEVAKNPHVLTFSELGEAIVEGAIAGHKSKVSGGVLTGAMLAVSLKAGERVVLLAEDLMQNKSANGPTSAGPTPTVS
jgi:hypothetical protein